MKLSTKQSAVAKSYARSVLVAWSALIAADVTNWQAYGWSAFLAIVPPALRALDKKDAAFGRVAAVAEDVAQRKVSESSKGKPTKPKRVTKDA